MKKLLAMILCVAMVLSIAPAAFAAGWDSKAVSKEAIKDANDAIKYMYNAIVADEGVFATVSAVDGFVSDFSKELFSSVDGTIKLNGNNYTQEGLEKGLKKYIRTTVGEEINDYLTKHKGAFTNSQGVITKPDKYLQAFATAASKAVSSEKAVKALQAIALDVMFAKLTKDMADNKDDLVAKMIDWDSDYQDIYDVYGIKPSPLANGNDALAWQSIWASNGDYVEPFNVQVGEVQDTMVDVNDLLQYYVP